MSTDFQHLRIHDEWKMKKKTQSGSVISKLLTSNFIAKSILTWIAGQTSFTCLNLESKYANITLCSTMKVNEETIKRILRISMYFMSISRNKNVPQVLVILTPFTKKLNDRNVITPEEVNSGYSDGIAIRVWRQEEMEKVLIHEMIHFHEIDFGIMYMSYDTYALKKKKINVNESITETLATIIYAHNNNIDLKKEVEHSLYQAAKLFHYFGFKTVEEFTNSKTDCIFNETTNAFAYYILKSYLLFAHSDIILTLLTSHQNKDKLVSALSSFSPSWINEINTRIAKNSFDKGLLMTI